MAQSKIQAQHAGRSKGDKTVTTHRAEMKIMGGLSSHPAVCHKKCCSGSHRIPKAALAGV